jgi:hypothetical protein
MTSFLNVNQQKRYRAGIWQLQMHTRLLLNREVVQQLPMQFQRQQIPL